MLKSANHHLRLQQVDLFAGGDFFFLKVFLIWSIVEIWASLVAQLVKNLPAMQVMDLGQSLGWEDPLEKGMAIHSSILAWG